MPDEPEDGLSLLDPARCRCMMGYCTNRITVADCALCDRCYLEYAAARNLYLTIDEV